MSLDKKCSYSLIYQGFLWLMFKKLLLMLTKVMKMFT